MKYILLCIFVVFISCYNNIKKSDFSDCISAKIEWRNEINEPFLFTRNWDYAEGIFKNEFGQLTCDGLCPREIDRMKDEQGMILKDSISSFYQFVDTSHQFHTIQCDAWCYEWAGTNYIDVVRNSGDTIILETRCDAATHSALVLEIVNGCCIPKIILNSIASPKEKVYFCRTGQIQIDQKLWDKGIIKAIFDFTFNNTDSQSQKMFWKGKMYLNLKVS
jgi:hypothetical protein